jgi:hypothetical protein
MSFFTKVALGVLVWVAAVTLLHLWLNTEAFSTRPGGGPAGAVPLRVGFIPVT